MIPEWPIKASLAKYENESLLTDHERAVLAGALCESPAYVKMLDSLVASETKLSRLREAHKILLTAITNTIEAIHSGIGTDQYYYMILNGAVSKAAEFSECKQGM